MQAFLSEENHNKRFLADEALFVLRQYEDRLTFDAESKIRKALEKLKEYEEIKERITDDLK